ncbi:hypothetical protein TSAR_010218 [Trichomalopsis sarcophagae]|uniref:Uncharacterized protein n=1 Tax=Trichomalopsis sarcophagae TaxID=543379 RepID=A0A232FN46_9HYME|nr:hypothetical protein TSAR_010218 [Trichomalopsis sarcophagae]
MGRCELYVESERVSTRTRCCSEPRSGVWPVF